MQSGRNSEPSMDDILASIRKIISEDPSSLGLGTPAAPSPAPLSLDAHRAPVATGTAPQRPAGPETPPTAGGSDDLSDLVEGSPALATPTLNAPTPTAPEPLGASLGALAAGLATLIKTPQPAPAPSAQMQPAPAAAPSAILPTAPAAMIDEARVAPADAAPLAPQPSAPPSVRSLEEAVAEMLRPMLQRWVDENVPALAERIVREHVRRRSEDA
jgi:cell pole-organizing protein PopZ